MASRSLGIPLTVAFLVAAGCTQTATNTMPPAPSRTASTAQLTIRLVIARRPRSHALSYGRLHQYFIAANTAGIELQVFAHGQRTHPLATVVENIAPGSPLCTNVANGRACSFAIDLPPGTEDFVAVTYDRAPSGNTPVGKKLGAAVATRTIARGKANQLKITIGGILSNVLLSLPLTVIPAINPLTQHATITGLDPDGNVILTDAYVDSNGKPVSITVSADSAAGLTLSLTPKSISAPGTVAVTYSPRAATNSQVQNGFTTVLVAQPSNGVASSTRALTVKAPQIAEFPIPSPAEPIDLVAGSDGNLWYGQINIMAVARVTQQGHVTNFPPPTLSQTWGVATGADGNVWFAEISAHKIGKLVPSSGAITEFTIPSGNAPEYIAPASDGSLWFTEALGNAVGRITSDGTIAEMPIPTAATAPNDIVQGPDGNMWFTQANNNAIGRVTKAGAFKEFTIPTAGAVPRSITVGSDGALWFAENNGNKIGRITTGGTFQEFSIPATATRPLGIASGPDGAIWFTECVGNKIGRIPVNATSGSQIVEFAIATTTSEPDSIVLGPDGALWFLEYFGNNVGRLQ